MHQGIEPFSTLQGILTKNFQKQAETNKNRSNFSTLEAYPLAALTPPPRTGIDAPDCILSMHQITGPRDWWLSLYVFLPPRVQVQGNKNGKQQQQQQKLHPITFRITIEKICSEKSGNHTRVMKRYLKKKGLTF